MYRDSNTYLRLCVVLLLLAMSVSQAGAMQVGSFTLRPTDISASRADVRDLNNNVCALIRVALPVEGCKFEGNIIKAEYDVNEYLVFVSGGTKMMRIKCPGTTALDVVFGAVSDIESVEGGSTYALELSGYNTSMRSPVHADPGGNYLILDISPKEGLFVRVDDKVLPVEDGQGMVFLKYGPHTFEILANGYETVKKTVNIGKEGNTTENIVLRSVKATLSINPETPGATIKINNRDAGKGSYSDQLASGTYMIEVSKEGYHTYTQTVDLKESETRTLTIPALTPKYGAINVAFTPIGSQISVDDKAVGSSPTVIRDVLAGKHSVTVSKDGYEPYTGHITVAEGETAELQGKLSAKVSAQASSTASVTPSSPAESGAADNLMSCRTGSINGHEYVDLGLPSGLKWATMNVGASDVLDPGDFYAWGETETKTDYSEKNSKTHNKKEYKEISGNPRLDPAARKWESTWRMPTENEADEFVNYTKWELKEIDGKNVYKITGPNGNFIWLPCERPKFNTWIYIESIKDDAPVWTGTAHSDPEYSRCFGPYISGGRTKGLVNFEFRNMGLPVRPVSE